MKKIIIASVVFLSIAVSANANTNDLCSLSAAEATHQLGSELTQKVKSQLETLNVSTLPHETLDLRKDLASLREITDLFPYVFNPKSHSTILEDLREFLDEGYEAVGVFKDIFISSGEKDPEKVNYDQEKVQKQLKKVLDWKDKFLSAPIQSKLQNILQAAEASTTIFPENRGSSKFYWEGITSQAKSNLSAGGNTLILLEGLLGQAQIEIDNLSGLDELIDPADPKRSLELIDTFHDFRKRVRSVTRLLVTYPELDQNKLLTKYSDLLEVVDRYGKLNDDFVKLHKKIKNGEAKPEKIEKLNSKWKKLKLWQTEKDIKKLLKKAQSEILIGDC